MFLLIIGNIWRNIQIGLKNNNNIQLYYPAAQVPATGVGCSRAELMPALQAALSCGSVSNRPHSRMSLLTQSLQAMGGLPRPLLSFEMTSCVTEWIPPVARATCPCHLSLRDLRTEVISSSPSLERSSPEGILSISLTPQIQRIMALSVRCRRRVSATLGAQVSLPWSMAERTQVLYTLPRVSGDRCLVVRIGRSLLNLPQATLHLALIACIQPPPALSISPR